MRQHRLRLVGFAAVLCCLVPGLAYSQAPAFVVSGEYLWMIVDDRGPAVPGTRFLDNAFHGWTASLTARLRPRIGITGEVGGSHRREPFSIDLYSFMAGPRLDFRPASRTTVFGHLLVGGQTSRISIARDSVSLGDFAIQLGGGVDVWTAPRVGLRAALDYRRVFAEPAGLNEFRFHTGVLIGVGSR